VRPEKLVQTEDAGAIALGPGANTCKGLVEETIYVGDFHRATAWELGPDGAVVFKAANRVGVAASRHRGGGCSRVVTGGHASLSRASA